MKTSQDESSSKNFCTWEIFLWAFVFFEKISISTTHPIQIQLCSQNNQLLKLLSQGTILCQNVMVVKPIEYMLLIKLKNINLIYLKNKGKLNPIDSILCNFHCLFSFNRFWGLCEPVYVHEERWKYFRAREVATETKSKENSNFLYRTEKKFLLDY